MKLHQVLSIVALSLSSVFLNPQKDRISLAVYCMHILLPFRKEVVFAADSMACREFFASVALKLNLHE